MLEAQFPILALDEDYVINDFPLHRFSYDSSAFEQGQDEVGTLLFTLTKSLIFNHIFNSIVLFL